MFKKRNLNKSNVRERTGGGGVSSDSAAAKPDADGPLTSAESAGHNSEDRSDEEEARDGETVAQRLARIKEEQNERKRAAGLEVTASISSSLPAAGDKATQKRSIVDVMGGQYRIGSRQELSGSNMAHADIMEAYIAERLGPSAPPAAGPEEVEKSIFQRLDDELYKIPDNIKQLAGPSKASSSDVEIVSAGMGLAEVILPPDYHRKNIEATEAARSQILKSKRDRRLEGAKGAEVAGSLFAKPAVMMTHGDQVVSNFHYQQGSASRSYATDTHQEAVVPLPGEVVPGSHQPGHGHHGDHSKKPRFGYSTDQAAVQRFKQRAYK